MSAFLIVFYPISSDKRRKKRQIVFRHPLFRHYSFSFLSKLSLDMVSTEESDDVVVCDSEVFDAEDVEEVEECEEDSCN